MSKQLTPRVLPQSESHIVAQAFSGPLPPPTILNQYDEQTRHTIVKMADRQSLHRQSLERALLNSNITNEHTGMWIAAVLTAFMLICGVYLLINDKNAVGFLLVFGPAIFHVGNYIYFRRQESQEKKKPARRKKKNL